jgi:hypothetical protein
MNYPFTPRPFEMSEMSRVPMTYSTGLAVAASETKADPRSTAYPRSAQPISSSYLKNGWEPIEDWRID